jgi:uncharacterized protein (DUF697 family)
MSSHAPSRPSSSAVAATPAGARRAGRLAVLSAYAMAANAVPLPFVPDRLVSRIRGAVVQDIAAQHGLSLTSDARQILAEPHASQGARAFVREALEFGGRRILRRLGSFGVVGSVVSAFEVFALGHLFDRYVAEARSSSAVRVHAEEAREARRLIDRSLARAAAPSLTPAPQILGAGHEDLRDEFTRWLDTMLLTGASLPSYVERRLDAAFDEVRAQQERGHG